MRSIREGKSRVTRFTLIPICERSCWIMVSICSRDLLPALVMTVNSTRFPEESRKVPPSSRNPAWASSVSDRGCFFLQAVEVFGVKSVDQMNFAATEAQQFNVAIPLNIEPNRIEIGQRLSLFVLFPVIRIPAEDRK